MQIYVIIMFTLLYQLKMVFHVLMLLWVCYSFEIKMQRDAGLIKPINY